MNKPDQLARLEELQDKFVRESFLEDLYEQAIQSSQGQELLPYCSVTVLDYMLQDLLNKNNMLKGRRNKKEARIKY